MEMSKYLTEVSEKHHTYMYISATFCVVLLYMCLHTILIRYICVCIGLHLSNSQELTEMSEKHRGILPRCFFFREARERPFSTSRYADVC
jgi:hypothetical protein